jgi:hypothetical protein
VYQFFSMTLGLSSSGIGWFGAAVCAVWAVLSYSLGRANEARRAPAPISDGLRPAR